MSLISRPLPLILLLAMFSLAALNSCSWRESRVKPSVLVIMVNDLGFGSFSCGEESRPEDASGFEAFCQESVRFTHAYTPSTMSQPAVASLLTGFYPRETGVRHNGPQGINPALDTVSEVAKRRGFKTSFVSGGPPVWRRGGFNQGFDIFDDTFPVTLKHLYRPAKDVLNAFLNWQDTEAPRGGFFSMLYLSDLQFVDEATTNELGDLRESSYRSQVEEVGASLGSFIRELKRRHVWDETDVVLLGLSGFVNETRIGEPVAMNLFSESTHTTLMIKPSRRKRDGPFNWKVDANVSLVDVGTTLFDLVQPDAQPPVSRFHTVSLRSVLEGPTPKWPVDRAIVTESAWAEWRDGQTIRVALRQGPYFFLFDNQSLLFNTLTDSLETSPLPSRDSTTLTMRAEFSNFLAGFNYAPWVPLQNSFLDRAVLARELWRAREPDRETLVRLKTLSTHFPDDQQLIGWRAIWALRHGDWKELETVADKANPPQPTWRYVAEKNILDKPVQKPVTKGAKPSAPLAAPELPHDPCFMPTLPKECTQESARALVALAKETPFNEHSKMTEDFLRAYSARALVIKISERNAVTGWRWDTAPGTLSGPDPVDLLLALPEMKRLRSLARARALSESK